MAETKETTVVATEEKVIEKTPGKIVSAGKSQPMNFQLGSKEPVENRDTQAAESKEGQGAAAAVETPEAKAAREAAANKVPELSDDQLKEILKGKGISFDDFESLKKKVEYTPPAAPLSEEEKKKLESYQESLPCQRRCS